MLSWVSVKFWCFIGMQTRSSVVAEEIKNQLIRFSMFEFQQIATARAEGITVSHVGVNMGKFKQVATTGIEKNQNLAGKSQHV